MVNIKNRYTGEVICSGERLDELVRANIVNLSSADLRSVNLRSVDLRSVDLRYADLRYANLSYADLRYANLSYADLRYANLSYIKLAYQSHNLFAEILKRAAGDDIAKQKVAGFILINRDKCWKDFAELAKHDPLGDWALDELAKWVQDGDDVPEILKSREKAREG